MVLRLVTRRHRRVPTTPPPPAGPVRFAPELHTAAELMQEREAKVQERHGAGPKAA